MFNSGLTTPAPGASDKTANRFIDSLEFARGDATLTGKLALIDLPRLTDTASAAEMRFELRGGIDELGRHCLNLTLNGWLKLHCQRCLEPFEFPMNTVSRLLLIASGAPWPNEDMQDDHADAIIARAEQSVTQLIEDEVLLALPLSPRHAAGDCAAVNKRADETMPQSAASPFAALAGLLHLPTSEDNASVMRTA